MYSLLIVFHLLVCFGLVAVVLLQSGTKGGGLAGGAFGGSAQTVFGGRGATDFVTRATMVLGTLFFVTSLVLAKLSSGSGATSRSLLQEEARKAQSAAPAQPGAPARGPQSAPIQQGVPLGGTKPATGPAPAAPAPAPAKPGGGK
ncbi:MAG TPA: preprotein translocase subunit SecG [Candidatus Eisenbacteria bacterium]|nr:preprotein translocase subunit SecG [Candidatus Eisenbacteria bacterium]